MEDDLEMEEVNYHSNVKSPWKKIIKTVFKHKGYAIGLLVSICCLATLDVCYPLINQFALEYYIQGTEPTRFDSIGWYILGYILVAFAYGITVGSFLFFAGKVEIKTSYELRKEAYLNLQQLPFAYFDRTAQGWIMARLTSDARRLSEIISWGVVDLLWGLLTMIGITISLIVINPLLSLVLLCSMPIILVVTFLIRKKMLSTYRDARSLNSKITAAMNEGFMGIKATKSLVIEDKNAKEFASKSLKYKKASLRAVFFSSLFGPFVFVMCYLTVGTTMYLGAYLSISVPMLYLFIDYTIKFFDPVMSVSGVLGEFQQARASAERIISLIEEKSEIVDTPEVVAKYGTILEPKYENFESLNGDIDFENVSFKYAVGEEVLHDFNLHVKAGQNIALVGHTGSGKSTIVNLICRFYEPTSGTIKIDGKDYKERSITWLHSNLGYVLQTPQLFTGSILDNVRYGNLKATDDDCIQALKTVAADEFIAKLDEGYNSSVGEGGNKLSLGEKQLISFARAIVSDPRILILDEATSSIDSQTESLIQHAVEVVLKGRTSFIVAHRLSTIVNADLILVMDEGKIVEQGTHHELLSKKGYYFELYKNQFTQESIEALLK